MTNHIFTLFGLGKLPFSASISSLFALIIFFLVYYILNLPLLNLIIFVLFMIIVLSATEQKKNYLITDPREVVIDEFLGMYLLLIIAVPLSILSMVVLFMIFRIIDLTKIWPFHFFDNMNNKYAFLFDDLFIGLVLGIIYILFKISSF